MKKILASLIAACMLASLAVPAFALNPDQYNPSTEAGALEEITELVASETEITVKNGETKELSELLTAYCGTTKIAMDYTGLEWAATDSLSFGLEGTTVVNIGEDEGSTTVTVKVPGKDIVATFNVKAAPADVPAAAPTLVPATGFKFTEATYTGYTNSGAVEMKVVPTNANGNFVGTQADVLLAAVNDAVAALALDATVALNGDNTAIVITVADSATVSANLAIEVALPRYNKDNTPVDATFSKVKRTAKIDMKAGKPAVKIIRTGSIKVEVGATADLNSAIALTSGATYDKSVSWTLDFFDDNYESMDYAVQKTDAANVVLGVAVGKVKAIATLDSTGAQVVVPVEVVEKAAVAPETPDDTTPPASDNPQTGDSLFANLF